MLGEFARSPRHYLRLSKHRPRPRSRFYATKQVLDSSDLESIHRDEHQHRSFRVRQDGPNLPLPPALDPVVILERSRWTRPKERPDVSKFTPFQKKLWENPYAHVLASPPRNCRSTNTLHPAALLTSLHPRPHPTTTAPWLLPVSLTSSSSHHLGLPFRFLSQIFIATKLGKKKAWTRTLSPRFIEKLGRKAMEEMVWREDMPELVLRLMRDRLVEKLKWSFGQRGQLGVCESPCGQHLQGIDDVSSVLYLKTLRTHADDLQDEVAAITAEVENWASYITKGFPHLVDPHKKSGVTHRAPQWYREPYVPRLQPRLRYPPLEFKTTVWRGKKVAVYSLVDLLGAEKVEELVKGSMYEGEKCLVIRSGRHSVPVEMLLLRLQCYLAEPGP